MKSEYNTLEVAIRIRSPTGNLLAEHTIRENGQVQLISYWATGEIKAHITIPLAQFVEEIDKLRTP